MRAILQCRGCVVIMACEEMFQHSTSTACEHKQRELRTGRRCKVDVDNFKMRNEVPETHPKEAIVGANRVSQLVLLKDFWVLFPLRRIFGPTGTAS